jgi:hypothetical protein
VACPKNLNSFSMSSSLMPTPVSFTDVVIDWVNLLKERLMEMPPWKVNLIAFSIKL